MYGRTKGRSIKKWKFTVIFLGMVTAFLLAGCGTGNRRQDLQDSAPVQTGEDTGGSFGGAESPGLMAGDQTSEDPDRAGSADDSDRNRENDAEKAEGKKTGLQSAKADPKEPLRVGDSLQDGDLRILYTASGKYDGESVYQQPQSGYEYIFLQFAFQNTGLSYDCPISIFSFQCFADGYAARAFYGGEKEPASSLSAGRSAIGNLSFCVPQDAREIEVEYQPDNLTQKKVRFLYEGEKDAGIKPGADTRRSEGAFRVGETAASDLQKITYVSCQKDDSDNEFLCPEEGCSFWTLTFEIENLREEDSQISVSDFYCYADGQSCSRRLFRDDYLSADIPGGRKAKGTVTFEVPDDAQTVEAEYKTGRRADARVVFTIR